MSKHKPLATRIYRFFIPKDFMGEFKRGATIGADWRGKAARKATGGQAGKASTWLQDKGRTKSEEWIAQRTRRFRVRYIVVSALSLAFVISLSFWANLPPLATAFGALALIVVVWQGYKWVIKQIRKGKGEK